MAEWYDRDMTCPCYKCEIMCEMIYYCPTWEAYARKRIASTPADDDGGEHTDQPTRSACDR